MANRISFVRKQRGMSQVALADALGVHVTTLNKMERGNSSPSIVRLEQIGRILQVPASELIGNGPRVVRIVGKAGAGPHGEVVFDAEEQELEEVQAPVNATDTTVGLSVQGDSMHGIANDGWLVFYDERRSPPTPDMMDELCVVGLEDDRVLVKFLAPGRGAGLFDLGSPNASTMRDVPVRWAALVTSIVPRKPARRMIRANSAVGQEVARTS